MAGTFSSFNTALSALRYSRVAMDTASGNIANSGTPGYTRRRVEAESVGGPMVPARWSRYDGAGDGVRVSGISRMVDPFLEARARVEHSNQSYLDTRQVGLERIESGIGEPGDNGVAAAIAAFRSGWHDLANNPDTDAARSQLLARGQALADAIGIQARNINTEAADQRARLQAMVAEVNTVAADLAATNMSIAVASTDGTDTGSLMDQRDVLALRLAELTGAKASANGQGGLDITLNGVALVSGNAAGQLEITTGVTPTGDADGSPVTFSVVDPASVSTPVPTGLKGEVGATTDLLNTTLPAYLTGLDEVARNLADTVNAQHQAGFDAAGAPGTDFFSYNPASPALSITVALTAVDQIAASGIAGGVVDGSNADLLGELESSAGSYQVLVNGFGTAVASVQRLAANQQMLTGQVDGSREQLAGVNIDEEMLAMVQQQHLFEAASRVISTLDSVLDTLINRTGLLR